MTAPLRPCPPPLALAGRATRATRAWTLVGALALAACASRLPEPTLHVLDRVRLPEREATVATGRSTAAPAAVWLLAGPIRLPDYLDRQGLLLPEAGGVAESSRHEWAEPLTRSVPRLLEQDLHAQLGARGAVLWRAPLPTGLQPQAQLRIDSLRLDVDDDGRAVSLQARWSTWRSQAPAPAARSQFLALRVDAVPSGGAGAAPVASVDALVVAHRRALWQLADAIVTSMAAP